MLHQHIRIWSCFASAASSSSHLSAPALGRRRAKVIFRGQLIPHIGKNLKSQVRVIRARCTKTSNFSLMEVSMFYGIFLMPKGNNVLTRASFQMHIHLISRQTFLILRPHGCFFFFIFFHHGMVVGDH